MAPRKGTTLGVQRLVDKRIKGHSGEVVRERLECGHVLDVRLLKPGKQLRKCMKCRNRITKK